MAYLGHKPFQGLLSLSLPFLHTTLQNSDVHRHKLSVLTVQLQSSLVLPPKIVSTPLQ